MISADELFSKGGCCLTREATRARCRGVLPLLETSFLWRIGRTTCRFIGRRRGHRRGGRGFWGGRGLRTLGPRKLRETSDSSFVRKSAASMLSGKRPVQAVPAKQKVGSGKSGGSKKGEVTVQSKASKSVEPPEDVEPAEMSLEEIESRLGSLIKADTISQLKSTVWKERLEAISSFKQEVEALQDINHSVEL